MEHLRSIKVRVEVDTNKRTDVLDRTFDSLDEVIPAVREVLAGHQLEGGDCLDRGNDFGDMSTLDGVTSEDEAVRYMTIMFGVLDPIAERLFRQTWRTAYLQAQMNFDTGA